MQQEIVSELAAAHEHLAENHFGRMVLRNCRVEQFQKKQDKWQSKQLSDEKKRKLFAEFLDEIDDGAEPDRGAVTHSDDDTPKAAAAATTTTSAPAAAASKARSSDQNDKKEKKEKKEKTHKKKKTM